MGSRLSRAIDGSAGFGLGAWGEFRWYVFFWGIAGFEHRVERRAELCLGFLEFLRMR